MSMVRTFVSLTILMLCGLMYLGGNASAAGGLTLSPPLKDITLGPGLVEANADISITNNSAQQTRVQLKLVDLKALGEFGGTSLDKAGLSDSYGLAEWLELPGGDSVVIRAGQTVQVSVRVVNRPDLSPGGHYGAIIATADNGQSVQGDVNISTQLVSLLFVKKLGGEKYGLDLQDIVFDRDTKNIPEKITLNFTGTGNVHVTPRGYVEIVDPKGKVVSRSIINQDSSLVLPESTREFVTLMMPVGSSDEKGTYEVRAYYRYDERAEFTVETTSFTRQASQRNAIILGMIMVAITALSVYLLLKHRTQRPAKKKQ